MRLFGGQGSGASGRTFRAPSPVQCPIFPVEFRIEEFLKTLSPKKAAEGSMDFSSSLSSAGEDRERDEAEREGRALPSGGEPDARRRLDLDRTFSRYEASQSFNLVDVGAFFVAGPFGPLITKGYNFGSLFVGQVAASRIRALVSDWKVERRHLRRRRMWRWLRTKSRIGARGESRCRQRTASTMSPLLWSTGRGAPRCARRSHGPFLAPEVEKVSVLQTARGPVLTLLKEAGKLLGEGQCEVFYAGSVPPPK